MKTLNLDYLKQPSNRGNPKYMFKGRTILNWAKHFNVSDVYLIEHFINTGTIYGYYNNLQHGSGIHKKRIEQTPPETLDNKPKVVHEDFVGHNPFGKTTNSKMTSF